MPAQRQTITNRKRSKRRDSNEDIRKQNRIRLAIQGIGVLVLIAIFAALYFFSRQVG
jgi:hypothetical protein